MSIVGNKNMGTPFFHELKKQASGYLKEKIKTARLALTDVTPTELLTEEVTNGNPRAPDTRTIGLISRAAFEIDDYWRIVEILHKRLSKFDRKHWREPYKALILLEHLLTHGPESIAGEFQSDREVIQELGNFEYIDERGFNWGLTVRKKSERILKLLEKGPLLKEERERARKVTRGIEGFGSFNQILSSSNKSGVEPSSDLYGRSNSQYEEYNEQEDIIPDCQTENSISCAGIDAQVNKKSETGLNPMKEDKSSKSLEKWKEASVVEVKGLSPEEESKPLLAGQTEGPKIEFQKEDHPFNNLEQKITESLLLL